VFVQVHVVVAVKVHVHVNVNVNEHIRRPRSTSGRVSPFERRRSMVGT
jgi:hypothetical protein